MIWTTNPHGSHSSIVGEDHNYVYHTTASLEVFDSIDTMLEQHQMSDILSLQQEWHDLKMDNTYHIHHGNDRTYQIVGDFACDSSLGIDMGRDPLHSNKFADVGKLNEMDTDNDDSVSISTEPDNDYSLGIKRASPIDDDDDDDDVNTSCFSKRRKSIQHDETSVANTNELFWTQKVG